MYTVMGVTGQVGAEVARALLAARQRVKVVVRDLEKGQAWAEKGCDVAVADANDVNALTAAFSASTGVFILLPPNFDPSEGFEETRRIIENLRAALATARPAKVVCISSIGAQARQPNLLNQLQLLEQSLSTLELPVTFLRPAWFMENSLWDIEPARHSGVIPSFLHPLDKPVPMIATADVGRVSAQLLQEDWQGKRIVELEYEDPVTHNDIAAALSELLGKPVSMEVVPGDTWESLFRSQGMNNPLPRIQMLNGFNEGWIRFEGLPRKGHTGLKEVLAGLLAR
ncbi:MULTISPECIES: NmrA family NAD(P)-binding protein [unclassified Pseudomonas]|uniref:NmrA family NAD(P)-binding protein n=1 Tax=unclassified Pseudomonas TaxID=196821 RepID=UPI00053668D3|nr:MULTISPECIES: NmrA family NAD(P)-binding protein [unclassified Pseudomonas]MBD0685641.1 NmrA family transcriptional regulator [Pseudomonas sp. PSB18]CDF95970.1 NmrA family protein [Pseudomonas sp. SHC52]